MSLSAAHASTPCGAPAITSSVVSTPAARSRCAYATSSSWNSSMSEVYSHAGGSPERSSRRAATA